MTDDSPCGHVLNAATFTNMDYLQGLDIGDGHHKTLMHSLTVVQDTSRTEKINYFGVAFRKRGDDVSTTRNSNTETRVGCDPSVIWRQVEPVTVSPQHGEDRLTYNDSSLTVVSAGHLGPWILQIWLNQL